MKLIAIIAGFLAFSTGLAAPTELSQQAVNELMDLMGPMACPTNKGDENRSWSACGVCHLPLLYNSNSSN
jgi:hypothetical protein